MLSNKYGFRSMVITVGILTFLGFILSYFATSLYYPYFTFGVLTGAGFGIAYFPSITAISCYFEKKLPVAAGIAAAGIGVGNIIYPSLINWLIHKYSWRESFLILGAISLHICLCGTVIRPMHCQELGTDHPVLNVTPFKKESYIMLCVNNFLFCCGISALYIHLTALAQWKGIDSDSSAILLSGLGAANLIGRIRYGLLSQYPPFNAFVVYGTSFLLSGLCICVIPFVNTFYGLLTCAVIFGLLSGCFGALLFSILIDILRLYRFANGYGCLLLFEAAGQLIGGSLTGGMFDLTEFYTISYLIGRAMMIASAFVMVQPYLYTKRHLFQADTDISVEKAMLSDGVEVPEVAFGFQWEMLQKTLSIESLIVIQKLAQQQLSTHSTHATATGAKLDFNQVKSPDFGKPLHKRIEAFVMNFSSTCTG